MSEAARAKVCPGRQPYRLCARLVFAAIIVAAVITLNIMIAQ